MTNRILTYFIAAAVSAPLLASTANADTHKREVRIYDREHHDYHHWNADEERAYRHYLAERHDAYRAYSKAKAKERLEYWKWRHEHVNEHF